MRLEEKEAIDLGQMRIQDGNEKSIDDKFNKYHVDFDPRGNDSGIQTLHFGLRL